MHYASPVTEPAGKLTLPPPRIDPNDLVGGWVFNTGVVAMDGKPYSLTAEYAGPRRFRVRKLVVWAGVEYGETLVLPSGRQNVLQEVVFEAIADVGCQVLRVRADGAKDVLASYGWDHYLNPSGPADREYALDPYAVLLAGDKLVLEYTMNQMGPWSPPKKGQVTVRLLGTYG